MDSGKRKLSTAGYIFINVYRYEKYGVAKTVPTQQYQRNNKTAVVHRDAIPKLVKRVERQESKQTSWTLARGVQRYRDTDTEIHRGEHHKHSTKRSVSEPFAQVSKSLLLTYIHSYIHTYSLRFTLVQSLFVVVLFGGGSLINASRHQSTLSLLMRCTGEYIRKR